MIVKNESWDEEEYRDTPKRMPECKHFVPFDTECVLCSDFTVEVPSYYLRECPYESIDIYRILDIYSVESHAIGHAVKKLLCAGDRGVKPKLQDYEEAIRAIRRQIEMDKEDQRG